MFDLSSLILYELFFSFLLLVFKIYAVLEVLDVLLFFDCFQPEIVLVSLDGVLHRESYLGVVMTITSVLLNALTMVREARQKLLTH
tara:strand:- start:248 stop:505 length:258 start_codon:yes stop_codon:yes gene_type:complete